METRTNTEIKMIKIFCRGWQWDSHGVGSDYVPGYVFCDEVYDEKKDYDEIFKNAEAEQQEKRFTYSAYMNPVEKKIYWKKID